MSRDGEQRRWVETCKKSHTGVHVWRSIPARLRSHSSNQDGNTHTHSCVIVWSLRWPAVGIRLEDFYPEVFGCCWWSFMTVTLEKAQTTSPDGVVAYVAVAEFVWSKNTSITNNATTTTEASSASYRRVRGWFSVMAASRWRCEVPSSSLRSLQGTIKSQSRQSRAAPVYLSIHNKNNQQKWNRKEKRTVLSWLSTGFCIVRVCL